ncbi:MAG: nucleoside-diphosphate sugar epimerase [Candidatus Paraimprobicoccus trichonymphae]|uniref:Nucleoside-diphosphate sugar epimerase n=1 Tax=Candidatus Paraimprobicoccus trichonymphae TaxID=3033793 RepID=A0AA48L068_9FIRM|nr:MAG: nucleoside-diphosphate sugar epimerase [Candidatus Paraimprobicoccus trichonymphae]
MFLLYEILKKYRKHMLFLCDLAIWNLSFYISFAVNKNNFFLVGYEGFFLKNLILVNICFSVVFLIFKLYDKIWRYADVEDFFYVGVASFCASFVFSFITVILNLNLGIRLYILFLLVSTCMIFVFRLVYRINKLLDNKIFDNSNKKRLLIVGAGEATASVLRELSKYPANKYFPICIVDDDKEKIGRKLLGVKIEGSTSEISEICELKNIEVILFSIITISYEEKKRILDICSKTNLEIRIIPNIYEAVTNNISLTSKIRKIKVEDLLERDPVTFDKKMYGEYIKNKNILITGGGGSIGSELCRQIAFLNPNKIIILDIYENSAYEIQQELKFKYENNLNLQVEIASIRDKEKIDKIFSIESIDVVFHAAAHKHVPLMEENPEEAVKNNIFGTLNLVNSADKYNVKKFVLISTDKAVNPTSVMGATKRICEMIIQNINKISKTEFVAVRFGNVLGSNGSVIPLFEEQIKNKGPVTVTHPEIIRYFMTISEAVSLVLIAGSLAQGGEIFVLDMGNPVKIKDLAENLIRLSGYTPNIDIKIVYTGLRPGEKLYEELLLNEEGIQKTKNKKIYIAKPIKTNRKKFMLEIEILSKLSLNNNKQEIKKFIFKILNQ